MRYFFWTVVVFILLVFLFNLFVSFGIVTSASHLITPISSFVSKNKAAFLVWHIFLYFAIFYGLFAYSNYLININKLSETKKKEATLLCASGTILVIVLDLIYYFGRTV